MLARLYATNYRCLVNFEFKPSAKQLIIGRNGTGKTTVFDVLAMLRDLAVRGKPCEDYLGGKTRTRWQHVFEERFELDVNGNGGEYNYKLVVELPEEAMDGLIPGNFASSSQEPSRKPGSVARALLGRIRDPFGPRVKEGILDFDGSPLYRFQDGTNGPFNDQQKPQPSVKFPFDGRSSGLAMVEAGRNDNKKLNWFKRWLGGLQQVQINPWAMSARSERESPLLEKDLSNFADWLRHLRLESGEAVFDAIRDLREALPGFEALDAKEAGLDVRVLRAAFAGPQGDRFELPFHDLSEGQRALIALYVLLHCAVGNDRLVLIDEPDNFIALAEIQPWLVKLLERVDDTNGEVILASHHTELLNQMAGQGGVILGRPGSGEKYVRDQYPHQVQACRSSLGKRAAALLIVIIHADMETTQHRWLQLSDALESASLNDRRDDEPIVVLIPTRHVETWIRALLGGNVDEVTDYTRPTPTPKEIKDAASELYVWTHPSATPGTTSPPPLTASLSEWQKIPS
jgi:ABC-type transport system involved in cytochrome c biogenesis ATPase subunit